MAEISDLGLQEDQAFRELRVARLQHELALAKISFVQSILEDMKSITKNARIHDKEIRATIKFLLKIVRNARRNGVMKTYRSEQSKEVQKFDVKNLPAG